MINEDNTDSVKTIEQWNEGIGFMLMELSTLTKDGEEKKFESIMSVLGRQLDLVTSIAPDP